MAFEFTKQLSEVAASYPAAVFNPHDFRNEDRAGTDLVESFDVPSEADGEGRYRLNLDQVPLQQVGLTVTVDGEARSIVPYGSAPSPGEVAVSFTYGIIEFNAADEGLSGTATYKGAGTPIMAHLLNQFGAEIAATQETLDSTIDGLGELAALDIAPIANGGTGSTTASAARTALGLEIGTNVQAYSSNLSALAALGGSTNQVVAVGSTPGAYEYAPLTAFARTILDDANAAAARATLELGTTATPTFASVAVGSGSESAPSISVGASTIGLRNAGSNLYQVASTTSQTVLTSTGWFGPQGTVALGSPSTDANKWPSLNLRATGTITHGGDTMLDASRNLAVAAVTTTGNINPSDAATYSLGNIQPWWSIHTQNADVAGTLAVGSAGSITFGADVNLYRGTANQLRTDDSFSVGGSLITASSLWTYHGDSGADAYTWLGMQNSSSSGSRECAIFAQFRSSTNVSRGQFIAFRGTDNSNGAEIGDIVMRPIVDGSLRDVAKFSKGITFSPKLTTEINPDSSLTAAALTLDVDNAVAPTIAFEGTSSSDFSSEATILTGNGTGAVEGPQAADGGWGWEFISMVKVNVNGSEGYMPVYQRTI